MFTEFNQVRQIPGDARRRWFCGDGLELIVWYGQKEEIIGFQLLYEANGVSKALTWEKSLGYLHSGIDDGEGRCGKHKQTPVLVPNGRFNKKDVLNFFVRESIELPDEIAAFVRNKLETYKWKE